MCPLCLIVCYVRANELNLSRMMSSGHAAPLTGHHWLGHSSLGPQSSGPEARATHLLPASVTTLTLGHSQHSSPALHALCKYTVIHSHKRNARSFLTSWWCYFHHSTSSLFVMIKNLLSKAQGIDIMIFPSLRFLWALDNDAGVGNCDVGIQH